MRAVTEDASFTPAAPLAGASADGTTPCPAVEAVARALQRRQCASRPRL